MRSVSHSLIFLGFIFYVISSSTSRVGVQNDEGNNDKFFTKEFIKIKEKFDNLFNQTDQLNNTSDWSLNRDQAMNQQSMELNRWKQREDDLLNEINELKKGQSEMKNRVGALEKSVSLAIPHVHLSQSDEYYKKKPDFTWTISDLQNKVKQTNFTLLSEVFPLKSYSFGAQANLTLDKYNFLQISLAYKDLNESGAALNLALIPQVHYTYKEEPSNDTVRENKEPDLRWTIDDIRNKVKQPNFALLSEVFPLKGYSFEAQAKLTLNKDNNFLYIKLAYKKTNKSENALNLRLVPSVRYTINNDTLRYETFPFAEVAQYDVFYYDRWITCAETLVSDTMSIDVRVEESPADCYSQNGSLSWAIDHFRLKREREEKLLEWFHVSPCFLTGPKGYRVGAYVSLNGFGEYEGLSADIVFLTGPFDADLGRSFKHRTTVTLFHPTDSTKVIVKSVDKDLRINRLYRINMGAHSEVENLLDGDTLYYQIKIIPA